MRRAQLRQFHLADRVIVHEAFEPRLDRVGDSFRVLALLVHVCRTSRGYRSALRRYAHVELLKPFLGLELRGVELLTLRRCGEVPDAALRVDVLLAVVVAGKPRPRAAFGHLAEPEIAPLGKPVPVRITPDFKLAANVHSVYQFHTRPLST